MAFTLSSCGVVRLSILPSQGSDPGFKSRREHFIDADIVIAHILHHFSTNDTSPKLHLRMTHHIQMRQDPIPN